MSKEWKAANSEAPCPICGKSDWCARGGDAVHCMRAAEAPPGWNVVKHCTKGGVIFKPSGENEQFPSKGAPASGATWKTKAEGFAAALTQEKLLALATQLGVTADSLREIGLGWNRQRHLYTFPERNGQLAIIGISTRRPGDGKKMCLPGSNRGLIIPSTIDRMKTLYVVEGASDVATALSVGLQAIGRPSACGGVEHLAELLETWEGEIVVLGENDRKENGDWPGRIGALRVAAALARRLGRPIRWCLPHSNYKDLRAWVRAEMPDSVSEESHRLVGDKIRDFINSSAEFVTDDKSKPELAGDEKPKRSQADLLVELVNESGVELFHTPGGVDAKAFATINRGTHRETWSINSRGFKAWLGQVYFEKYTKSPNSEALASALNTLKGQALYTGRELDVGVRVAGTSETIFIDLCDLHWRVVKISAAGWSVVDNTDCPIRFIRRKGMLAMPEPRRGGKVDQLRQLLNVPRNDDWQLVVAFLIICLHPRGPYTILCVNGEQGSAKTTLCRIIRKLLDPNEATLRRPPREERDLMIAASNSWLVAYTNLSSIPTWLSDALCALVYGEGGATRLLYTDDEEILFSACRPVMVNGIEGLMTRSDFADRCLQLVLPEISEESRRTDEEIEAEYRKIAPSVLGALFDSAACALKNFDSVKIDRLPRMATASRWVTAAEPALGWRHGTFLDAYRRNREGINQDVLEATPIGQAVVAFMETRREWSGSPTELHNLIEISTDPKLKKGEDWPKAPNSLSGKLRRLAPNLRAVGIHVMFGKANDSIRRRTITIKSTKVALSSPDDPADGPDEEDRPAKSAASGPENAGPDDPDGSDDLLPLLSGQPSIHVGPIGDADVSTPSREEGEI